MVLKVIDQNQKSRATLEQFKVSKVKSKNDFVQKQSASKLKKAKYFKFLETLSKEFTKRMRNDSLHDFCKVYEKHMQNLFKIHGRGMLSYAFLSNNRFKVLNSIYGNVNPYIIWKTLASKEYNVLHSLCTYLEGKEMQKVLSFLLEKHHLPMAKFISMQAKNKDLSKATLEDYNKVDERVKKKNNYKL